MTVYKDSLNLPETSFPMKANLAQREPNLLARWEDEGIYDAIRRSRQGSKKFVLHDGPPYANGHLHCGHALNKILKDIINKSKSLSGFDAPFVPGWDCHGLPIELNVEKKVGKAGVKLSAHEFRAKCRAYAASQINIQRDEFKRLGVLGDWQHRYATMDYSYEANIIRALGQIIKNGHLQQGFKPVHWCIDCGSALAEAEVDYEDKDSPAIDVAFLAVNPKTVLSSIGVTAIKPVVVPIWTTTPWTLPANEAVCLHPDLDYALIDDTKRYLLIGEDLLESVITRYGIENYSLVARAKGKTFEHIALQHPFIERQVPIVMGLHVTMDAGTGCVHTAPAHGPDDYQIGLAYQLPLINPVLANGCYKDNVPFLAGFPIFKANEKIIELLKERQVLLHNETIRHSYPHCWRHKSPMAFLATPQWFISMDKNGLRQAILKEIDRVNWVPDWGKARIASMIETRPDWCISRQRAWGTPMPLFVHKTSRELHPNTLAFIEDIASRVEMDGIDAWFDLDLNDYLGGEESQDYVKLTDTLDVWFDAGVSHYCVLKQDPNLKLPADVYFEGSDQHRGWFNSSITTAVAMYGHAPYDTVLTHGYTVDAEGRKLSKSKGNYVSLDSLINQHGADVLRLWVSSTDYRHEVSISEEIIKRNADAYRRLRNTARFLLANLFDFNPAEHRVNPEHLVELDRWAIKRTQILQDEIICAYQEFNFHVIYQKIHNFCAVDMGSFYLDIIKDRQYTTPKNSIARRSCQTAMYHIIHALSRWLAPILSFTAEEIWSFIPGQTMPSIFLAQWYTDWPVMDNLDMAFWQNIQAIRDEVNKALEQQRKDGVIGSGLAANVIIYANEAISALLNRLDDELRFVLITSGATVKPLNQKPDTAPYLDNLGISVVVHPSNDEKCERCWHRRADVGQDSKHPTLCQRCVDNLSGKNEVRQFA